MSQTISASAAASQTQSDQQGPEISDDLPRLSINQVTTLRWNFSDDLLRYREAGIQAMGVWLPKLVEFGEERAEVLLQEHDLSVSSLSWAGGFTGAFGHELDDVVAETRDWIHLAGRLRAETLVVVSGPVNRHINKHARRLVVDSLKELADHAAENNVILSLQPMRREFKDSWTFLNTLEHALQVIDKVQHPYVQLAFDTFHLSRETGVLNLLPELIPQIGIVQVSDAVSGSTSEYGRVLPGDGCLPVTAILNGLVEAGYRGYIDYQLWSEACWKSTDLSWLNRCRENFQRLCLAPRCHSAVA